MKKIVIKIAISGATLLVHEACREIGKFIGNKIVEYIDNKNEK